MAGYVGPVDNSLINALFSEPLDWTDQSQGD